MYIGGDKRIRTADICLAKAALYQLSYTPFFWVTIETYNITYAAIFKLYTLFFCKKNALPHELLGL